jgi:hypothetical protein
LGIPPPRALLRDDHPQGIWRARVLAGASGPLSADEIARLEEAEAARAAVIAVDDLAPEEITGRLTWRRTSEERPEAAE